MPSDAINHLVSGLAWFLTGATAEYVFHDQIRWIVAKLIRK